MHMVGFPDSSVGKESACNAGDPSFIPGSGRSTGEGIGYPLQYSGLGNSMDYSPWGYKESDTTEQLSLSFDAYGKESTCQCRRHRRWGFSPWVGKIPWSRKRQPTPVFLPRKSHDRRAWQATVHRVAKSQTCLSMSTWSLERWY